jgi:hypothetical protein
MQPPLAFGRSGHDEMLRCAAPWPSDVIISYYLGLLWPVFLIRLVLM